MAENPILETLGRQPWLGSIADRIVPLVRQAFGAAGQPGQSLKNFLHGVWLGHPLHPVLTDIPVGAWTTAAVFDAVALTGARPQLDAAARGAIAVGLAGAVGAAVTGLTDWSETDGRARRLGLLHGLLNLTATTLYAVSFVDRSRARAGRGRALSFLGYAIAGTSAYLGGHLVYSEQTGVNHAFGQDVSEEFTAVAHERELREGHPLRVQVGEVRVALVRDGAHIYALADRCAHLGGPLSEGTVDAGTITCPWHGSRYLLRDGAIVNGPATHPQPCYEVRVRSSGQVEIRMPAEQPAQQQADLQTKTG